MWSNEFSRFLKNPIVGVGIGNNSVIAASSHNVHIQLLTYTGIIGYFIFHAFLLTSLAPSKMSLSNYSRKECSFLILVALLIYINGFTNGLFHGDFNYSLFIVLALINNIKIFEIDL
jgi:hypothetical protein